MYYKCDYRIIFKPKCHFCIFDGMIKSLVEYDFEAICSWKNVEIIEIISLVSESMN